MQKRLIIRKEIQFKLSSEQLQEQTNEWGHFTTDSLFTVAETAGIVSEWANPKLINLEKKSAWVTAAVKNEIRKLGNIRKNGTVRR